MNHEGYKINLKMHLCTEKTIVFINSKEKENEREIYRCGSVQLDDAPDNKINSLFRLNKAFSILSSNGLVTYKTLQRTPGSSSLQQCLKYTCTSVAA
jgi:hypothetical protein